MPISAFLCTLGFPIFIRGVDYTISQVFFSWFPIGSRWGLRFENAIPADCPLQYPLNCYSLVSKALGVSSIFWVCSNNYLLEGLVNLVCKKGLENATLFIFSPFKTKFVNPQLLYKT